MRRAVSKMIWAAWEKVAAYAGRSYIAGPELEDGLRTCRRLSSLGFASTICFWNVEGDSPERIAEAYMSSITALNGGNVDCYLSVKLPPLKFDEKLLGRILEQAQESNTLVHFDSLEPEAADRTFSVITELARAYPRLGCTLPGRWPRSCDDAEIAARLGLHVRVVKGQWQDPQHPEIDLRGGFLKVIDRLAGRARYVAVATHDHSLAREALLRLQKANTPCTLELLYGLPSKPALKVARELSVPVRVYVPYGHGWLPYSLTQARRNPRILWWVLWDMLSPGSPFGSRSLRLGERISPN